MIIKHNRSGKQYHTTPEAWAKIQGRGDDVNYTVIQPETPKEIKAARATKNPGIEHNEGSNDSSPSENPGADN